MTETPPQAPTEPQPTNPDGSLIPTPEPDKGDESGFAVYDLTLRRFVSAIHPTKGKASDAVTKVKGHKYETRKV